MYTGSLPAVSNKEDWIVSSPLIDEDGEEVDLTDATFEMFICRQNCPTLAVLSGSTTDGKITNPTSTTFQWHYTPDDLSVLCAGTYDVFLRVTIDDEVSQILACTVPIVEGGPSS